ncbi:alpha-mannosidase [Marinitoga sp. 1197]|uniref:alpha-mannosidase n=1 Tax=Marinitoga sp. 1197 TaxID=1428449 RepID=UPI0006414D38|nr:glycoside hydrolase family 38 C-terminal domain-containing protein [Marinitoga sp. 1197]KLO23987.1 alpha-mannosidase [Marinitoga sp. 1197]
MYHKIKHEILRIKKMIDDIYPYQYIDIIPINNWEFFQSGKSFEVSVGFEWEYKPFPVVFRKKLKVPHDYYGEFWFGGETLIKIDGNPYGEINEYHKEIDLSFIADGKEHLFEAETVPYNLFGIPSKKTIFKRANLIKINRGMRKLIRYFIGISQLIEISKNDSLNDELSSLVNLTFHKIDIPHKTSEYLSAINNSPNLYNQLSSVWSRPKFEKFNGMNIDVSEALNFLEINLKKLHKKYPKIGNVYVVGHAHIDYAWLWPIEETKRKIKRTFSNATLLAKKYPYFTFIQSSPQMYEDIKNDINLFDQIKKLSDKGMWDLNGGMWVESDTKIPSIESLIRQFYYAQKFFKEKFGKYSNVCWLPDVFGFSWILPQIAKQAGVKYFFTTKLTWNEKNEFPYDICYWRGIDGSEILYHSFNNPKEGYNGHLDAECVLKTFNNFRNRDIFDGTLLTYGYGDGGGGPSETHMIDFEVTNNLPYVPNLISTTGSKFFETLNDNIKNKEIPIWDNELYFEFHRATHFSQLKTKKLHKLLEDELFFTEYILALENKSSKILEKSWKVLLTREFHDVIPGSSIKEVYEESESSLQKEVENCKDIISEELEISNEAVLVNYSNYSSDNYFITDKSFKLPSQKTYDGKYLYIISPLNKFSNKKLEKGKPYIQKKKSDKTYNLENNNYFIEILKDGIKVYDKKKKRSLFKDKGNILMIYDDVPLAWGAWDIDYNYKYFGEKLEIKDIKIVEDGIFRKVIRTYYEYDGTDIMQYISLVKDSKRIDIKTVVNWNLRKKLLKVLFPVDVLSRYARFDISGGYITRPVHKNTSYEKAMFEVYMHRWMEISEPDFGVAILNDGIYSASIDYNVLGLSLIHGPVYPDLKADEGKHEFLYSIMSHSNNLEEIYVESERLNKPLRILNKKIKIVDKFIDFSPLKVVSVFKAKNRLIIRLVEVEGKRGLCDFNVKFDYKKAYLSDILLDNLKEIKSSKFHYKPFKIYTLIFEEE